MASTIRDFFPLGDLDAGVVHRAAGRFPEVRPELLTALFRLGNSMVRLLEVLPSPMERHGLSPARWRLMIALMFQAGEEGASIGDLAGHLGVREPTVTATVDRMEHEGLVMRVRDEADRRRVQVRITARGRELFAALVPRLSQRLARFVQAMGGPEEVTEIAARLDAAVDELEAAGDW